LIGLRYSAARSGLRRIDARRGLSLRGFGCIESRGEIRNLALKRLDLLEQRGIGAFRSRGVRHGSCPGRRTAQPKRTEPRTDKQRSTKQHALFLHADLAGDVGKPRQLL
jgi:hypothetical protein